MNNNLNKIFSKTDCISEKMLNDYHDDKLSAKEKHSVEKHFIDCELCTDELEGMSLLKDKSQINIIVDEINENIKLRTQNNKPKVIQINFFMKLAASIAIFILVGSALFMINDLYKENEQRLAEQIKPSRDKIPDEKKVSRQVEAAGADDSKIAQLAEQAETDFIISGKISKRAEIDGDADESTNADRRFKTGEPLAPAGSSSETISKEKESKELIASDELAESKEEDVVVEAAVSRDRSLELPEDEISLQPVAVGNVETLHETSLHSQVETLHETSLHSQVETLHETSLHSDENIVQPVVEKSPDATQKDKIGAGEGQETGLKEEAHYLADYEDSQKKSKARKSAGAKSVTVPAMAKKIDVEQPDESKNKEYSLAGVDATGKKDIKAPAEIDIESSKSEIIDNQELFNMAIQQYEAKNYADAIALFQNILINEPDNYNTLYYSAVSYLEINKPGKAIVNFDKVLMLKEGEFYEAAKWYKALAYIKKDEPETAGKLLKEIIETGGAFKTKAEEMLEDLQ